MHIKSAVRAKYMLDSSEKCKELASSALLLRSRLKKAQICPQGNPTSAMSEALIYLLGFFGKTAHSCYRQYNNNNHAHAIFDSASICHVRISIQI